MTVLKYTLRCRISEGGFTLIEILLAIFISSIVLTMAYASFFQVIKSKEFNERELELYQEARVILSSITRDLTMAYARGGVYTQSSGLREPFFVGEAGELGSRVTFTSFSHYQGMDTNSSDQAEISYYLTANPENGLYYLMRRENPGMGVEEAGVAYPISERVSEFELSYVAERGDVEAVEEWDSSLSGSLPRGVGVRVVLRGPRGDEVEFSTLALIPVSD